VPAQTDSAPGVDAGSQGGNVLIRGIVVVGVLDTGRAGALRSQTPSLMNLSLYLDGLPTEELPAVAAAAERHGFRDILKAETIYGDAFTACAAMAMTTTRIRLGSGIAGVYGRSPVVFAMSAAALARLSGGRFILGLGLQSQSYVERWHSARYRGLQGLREMVIALRRVLTGEAVVFEGETLRIEGYRLAFPPLAPVPIYTAALGPRMIELAGELSDGLLGYFYTPAYIAEVVRPHVEAGARRAGRALAGFDLTWGLPTLVTDDPHARDLMRPQVVMYATAGSKSYNAIMEVSGFGSALAELRRRLAKARTIEDVSGAVSDDMLDAFTLCGTAAEVRKRLASLASSGVNTLYLFPIPPGHFHPLFKGHFPDTLHVPPPDLEGLRRNIEAIVRLPEEISS
jgi:alkanesulfonate monooxygenase SsuD/methylene tetrahydromethanopterin reductase-like flavin-dependent oxidoreductase (luciferase family)